MTTGIMTLQEWISDMQLLGDNPYDFTFLSRHGIKEDDVTLWCLIHPGYYYEGIFSPNTSELVGWRLFKVNG
jgi:hypothetical protein